MTLVILGAHHSLPKTNFFIILFRTITYWPKLKTFNLHMFYNEITSPIHKNHTPKNNEKTNKIQRPLHVTENRPSSKTLVFVTYLYVKIVIGRLPGTPPGRPKRSQNLPGELPRPPRALRGPPGTPRTPWEPRNPYGNQQKRKQNNIKRLKTTETSNMQTLSVQFMWSIS